MWGIKIIAGNDSKFKDILDKSPVGILFYNKDGKLTDANQLALEMGSISLLDVDNEVNLFDNPSIASKKEELLRKGRIKFQASSEFENTKNTGLYALTKPGIVCIDYNVFVIDSGYLVQIQDITEHKKAENILQESEEKFHTIFQSAPFAIALMRLDDGVFVDINKQFTKLYGYTKEDAVGKTSAELGFIRDLEGREQFYEELPQHKYAYDVVGEIFTKSGESLISAANFGAIEIGGVKHLLVSSEDVTERKKMEEKLRESEEKFHTIFQSAPFAIALATLDDGVFVDINKQFTKLYGYAKEDAVGKNSAELGFIRDLGKRKQVLKEVPQHKYTCNIVGEAFKKSGEPIISAANFGVIEIGGVKHVLTSSEDATEREKAKKALKEAHDNLEIQVQERTKELKEVNEELKVSNGELQQFAYIISHDLQEPLRTIAGFTQLLEKRYKDKSGSDADEFMGYIIEAAARMKQMIDDLLEYSRAGASREKLHSVDAGKILNRAVLNLHGLIEESQAEITYDSLPTVTAGRDQLQRVFQNLIGNAIKFKKPDESPKVHISVQKEGDEYVFSVSDNGIGMEEQYLDHIFTIFQRLHTKEEYPGTGIGLSIVKRIIEHHRGRIWAESELGEGSTFYFTLPSGEVR